MDLETKAQAQRKEGSFRLAMLNKKTNSKYFLVVFWNSLGHLGLELLLSCFL